MAKVERPDKQIEPGSFGFAVYTARKRAGIGLDEAGRAAGFKSGSYLSLIEYSQRTPLLKHVPDIAAAIRVDPAWLIWQWLHEFARPVFDVLRGREPDLPT